MKEQFSAGKMSLFSRIFILREEILKPGKQPKRARARSPVCYWAVKELGMTNGTAFARSSGIIQSSYK